MGISYYPNGFNDGVSVRGLPVLNTYGGNVYWVDSNTGSDSSAHGGTYKRPYATIDYAVGRCTANNGDIVMVFPGHTETLSAAGDITLDVAGVSVIGLGTGSDRPQITLGTAATTEIVVSAANVTMENFKFFGNFADIANLFQVTAQYFTLRNCSVRPSGSDLNILALVNTNTTDGSASGLTLDGIDWVEPDTATTAMVDVNGDLDQLVVKNCYVNLGVNTSDLPIVAYVATGKDLTDLRIENNRFVRLNDANPLLADPDTTTANTGVIADNYITHRDTAGELLVTAATVIGFFNNYATAAADASGYLLPAADS